MFDVVVIGAGSAGAVVAARASEHPQLSVALLEAGPDYPLLGGTPPDLVDSHDNSYTAHDWGWSYLPTSRAERPVPFPRGRVTGGSSAVNTTIALRGVPEDYDHWAELGNPGWAWDDVLPAFRRLERDLDFGHEPYHGDAGPITIRRYRDDELTVPQAAWLEAAAMLGYPSCADANDPTGWGAGPHPMNKVGRVRVSTAVGYLAPARVRPNLTIRGDAPVRRLLVDDRRRVVAAELHDGSRVEGRLFVLSAGAVASPGVLERSGIGRPEVLDRLGVEVVADVAGVGENLQDHPAAAVACEVRDGVDLDLDSPIVQTILRYTAPGSELRNDLQIEVFSFARRRGEAVPRRFAIAGVLEQCFSRGSVHLTSTDPAAPPAIAPALCSDERDVERLAIAFLDAVAFTAAKPLADIVERVTFPRLPVDLDAARELVARFAGSGFHPCGSLRMGPAGDAMSVVDERGRCRAVEGLVVADASIMPTVPRANTNLTAIMIGEMVGEWIRTEPEAYGL
ncbi:MAG TPA: GMC family oxidoreductase N-terminal domain-containing protein [Acidimicrobiales bacterium]|nr:GMC family oxidoreductase N-terminal domain-containing protein [Acidimicrobiales bacterium]